MNSNKTPSLIASVLLFITIAARADDPKSEVPPPVPGFPIGRCVQVLNVTTPEEAKQVGFEYLELALQNLLPLSDEDFAKQVARIRGIDLPVLSGYGFLPGDLRVVGTNVNRVQLDEVVRRSLSRVKQFGLTMVIYGNSLTATRKVPEGFRVWSHESSFSNLSGTLRLKRRTKELPFSSNPCRPKART